MVDTIPIIIVAGIFAFVLGKILWHSWSANKLNR